MSMPSTTQHLLFLLSLVTALFAVEPALADGFPGQYSRLDMQQATGKPKPSKINVRFFINEPCSLQRFIETLGGDVHSTSWVKDWFYAKRGADREKDKELIKMYRKSMDHYGNDTYMDVTGRRMNLAQKLSGSPVSQPI